MAQNTIESKFFWLPGISEDLGICVRVKRPFRGIRVELCGIRATAGPFFKRWPFFLILQPKSRFKVFFGHFGLFNPNPSPNDKKRLKAPTWYRRQSKKRHFLAGGVAKNTNKNENQLSQKTTKSAFFGQPRIAWNRSNGLAILP